MGKKAFEEIGKILLVSFISILITATYARRRLIDNKLDKTEYETDQEQRWEAHDKIQELNNKKIDDTYDMVKFLYENEIRNTN